MQPRASRNTIVVDPFGGIRVYVTAAPTDGQANEAVLQVLAKALGIPTSTVAIAAGAHARNKTVRIASLEAEEALARLRLASASR